MNNSPLFILLVLLLYSIPITKIAAQNSVEEQIASIFDPTPRKNIRALFRYQYIGHGLVPIRRFVYSLNDNGTIKSHTQYKFEPINYCDYWNGAGDYQYDENDKLRVKIEERWTGSSNNGCEVNGTRHKDTILYSYNESGLLISEHHLANTLPLLFSYSYDSINQTLTQIQSYDPLAPIYKTKIQLDSAGLLATLKTYPLYRTSYDSVFHQYSYDEQNRLLGKLLHIWDTAHKEWIPSLKVELIYNDEAGSWAEVTYQLNRFQEWYPVEKNEYYTQYNYPLTISSEPNFAVFPNPANNRIYIRGEATMNGAYVIRDLQGKVLINGEIAVSPGTAFELNIEALRPGSYFITIDSENKFRTVRFIKK